MKTLYNYIMEGGHAVACERIPAGMSMVLYKEVSTTILKKYKVEMAPLGSVGKKADPDTNGDIDIAITVKDKKELKKILDDCFPFVPVNPNTTPDIISISYPYGYHGQEHRAQVDFMVVDDLKWAIFFYSSPNYINHESQFKASIKNILISLTCSCVPSGEPETKDEAGNLLTRWKWVYSSKGIYKKFQNFQGQNGLLKHPKLNKDMDIFLSKNQDDLQELLFTDKVNHFNSAESMWRGIHSKTFRYPEILPKLEDRFATEVLAGLGVTLEDFKKIAEK